MIIGTADPIQFDDYQIFGVALEDGEVMFAIEVDHMDPVDLPAQVQYAMETFDPEQAALCLSLNESIAVGSAFAFTPMFVSLYDAISVDSAFTVGHDSDFEVDPPVTNEPAPAPTASAEESSRAAKIPAARG